MKISTRKPFLLLILTVFMIILLSGCENSGSLPRVSLKPTDRLITNPQPIENTDVLRVGVASVMSPRETREIYQSFAEYLQKKIGRPVELVQRQSYQEINDLVRDGGVDIAFICSGAYVMGRDDHLDLVAVPEVKGKTTYQSYVIVNANSNFEKLEDLKGQVFAFTDPISFSGTIAPTYMVELLNSKPTDFFSRVVYTYSHDNSIKAVLDSVVAGAAVDSLVYEYAVNKDPSLKARLRIIAKSPEVGSPPVVVNHNIAPPLKEVLQEALLQMDRDPLGKKALESLIYDRFALPNDLDYDPIRAMVERISVQSAEK